MHSLKETIYYIITNLDSELIIQLTYASHFWQVKFCISIANQLSDYGRISCGVPQGSILGPLRFLIYVNDMLQAVNSNLFLYADDSCLMFQHKDVEKIERVLNNEFENICDWFVDNTLR